MANSTVRMIAICIVLVAAALLLIAYLQPSVQSPDTNKGGSSQNPATVTPSPKDSGAPAK